MIQELMKLKYLKEKDLKLTSLMIKNRMLKIRNRKNS